MAWGNDAADARLHGTEIAESVIPGRKTGAEMARLFGISQPTVSRIVAEHRTASPAAGSAVAR